MFGMYTYLCVAMVTYFNKNIIQLEIMTEICSLSHFILKNLLCDDDETYF